MNTKIEEQAAQAAAVLKKGGVVLYPTDTVWGIGCDATNADAVERIYRIKRSENKKSMLMLVASAAMAERYATGAPAVAWELMEVADKPLTLILPGASGVAANLVPDEGTIGMRVPDDAFCQAVLRLLKRPLVSTSANITGEPTPMTYAEITDEIRSAVDFVVDPACESAAATHKPSSLIAIGAGGEVTVIRE
ncbi:MAG: L-threonylcarbamoyladenylate synthase [Rikenellaceae bacterium]|nr:L-threonylcarbamoyladenylate synthase [Rikenellaceae bacterium]MCL2692349.1 L-threonylcarbamoyladenylate synthase [Rikenellaceae bacterium]